MASRKAKKFMPKKHYIPAGLDTSAPLREIANKYGVSISTASRWRRATLSGNIRKIQRSFSISSRILGILWAIGGDNGECFYLRCRYRGIIEEVRDYFNLDAQIIEGKSSTNKQFKLKITGDIRQKILYELSRQGWSPRNADIRNYPSGDIEHREFIRAWLQLHSSFDFRYFGKPRLRVYGNKKLITEMNDIISRLAGVSRKTPYKLHNNKTYALYYVSKDVKVLNDYFSLDLPL